jgi:hypothetical protein
MRVAQVRNNPYTCAWGGNRRGLGKKEEGPAPYLYFSDTIYLLLSLSMRVAQVRNNPYTCAWGGNRRGLGKKEEGPAPYLYFSDTIYLLLPLEDIDKQVSVGVHLLHL